MGDIPEQFRVINTPDKGRVCVATQGFKAGDILFEDTAFVHASELPERCLACRGPHEASSCEELMAGGSLPCPPDLLGELDAMADDMCDLDAVNTLDRARCFIQCMLMYRENPLSLDSLGALTVANLPRCVESVVAIRQSAPGLLPEGMSDDAAAKILGALNTNSHELEQVEGSGLFLLACIMEHDCAPNCSFTTFGDKLWLTAIREVGEGERLSIDYGNNFYLPTTERQAELEDIYGFVCTCRACTVLPDRCRAFLCPSKDCRNGRVCPHGDGEDHHHGAGGGGGDDEEEEAEDRVSKNWGCLDCGRQCSTAEIEALVAAEEALAQAMEEVDDLTGVESIDALVRDARVIHPSHYVVFWALESTAKRLSRESSGGMGAQQERLAVEAEAAWTRLMAAVEDALPALHHEKVVYLDALAQARVVCGDIKGARDAYEEAYRVSVMVSGADTPPTLDVKSLAERPPTTANELRARYTS
ncbi:unnamed protein product [Pylaiella littoralis]